MRRRRFLAALTSAFAAASIAASAAAQPAAAPQNILFLGDSLTAGYGLPDPVAQAYPALIQKKLDALGGTGAGAGGAGDSANAEAGGWRVINAGVSGDTSSGGLRRIDWVLRQPVSILVLALGSNDGLRGLDPRMMADNLVAIVDRVRAKNPRARVLLLGQRMPTSMGDYAARFDAVFPKLARDRGWVFVPFLLEGVGGVRELNQADAIHPNEDGHRRMAETVWAGLKPLLGGTGG